jgi:hypothetical protein
MTRREESARLKELFREVVGCYPDGVRCGRGTASYWKYIYTNLTLTEEQVNLIEKRALDEQLIGSYQTDYGPVNYRNACLAIYPTAFKR